MGASFVDFFLPDYLYPFSIVGQPSSSLILPCLLDVAGVGHAVLVPLGSDHSHQFILLILDCDVLVPKEHWPLYFLLEAIFLHNPVQG